ncbi:MAG: hypothetical protein IT384_31610 [Deltaproteobacteria bacterium]|nr:hypothetical protein [Deltaproteobacteria bacterium]
MGKGWLTRAGVGAMVALLAGPASAALPIQYQYRDHTLAVILRGELPAEPSTVQWRRLTRTGTAAWKTQALLPNMRELELPVGIEAAHEVKADLGGELREIWASRGVWFTERPRVEIAEHDPRADAERVDARDVLLAGGASARVLDAGRHVELGRTFGDERGRGIPVGDRRALVLIARGNGAAVRLTLAVRAGPKRMAYFDYLLTLAPHARRYVIPLDRFVIRERPAPPIRFLHSFSLRSLEPATTARETLAIDFVGLTDAVTGVRAIRRTKTGVRVRLDTPRPVDPTVVYARAAHYFVCSGPHAADPQEASCDPADAPGTSYQPPPDPSAPVLLDDFGSPTPVSAFREPTALIASSFEQLADLTALRRDGALELRFHPRRDVGTTTVAPPYGGYSVPIPEALGRASAPATVELTLRGTIATSAVRVGVRDQREREPQIALRHYLDRLDPQHWRTVRVPLEAFRGQLAGPSRGAAFTPRSLSVLLTPEPGSKAGSGTLQLDQIVLSPQVAPLVITRFESEPLWQTTFGGLITEEHGGDAKVELLAPSDRQGRVLSVALESSGASGYVVVFLGLGEVDARRHQALTFEVRGEAGGEQVKLGLSDRKRKATVELPVTVTQTWQKVRVPLSAFGPALRRDRLFQLLLIWEEKALVRQRMFFDDLALE